MIINILYRFKIYTNLVVDDNKNIWELPNCPSKRTHNLRKLTYYKERDAYRFRNQYISRKRLSRLMYIVNETFGKEDNILPF
jgi:hypothetical protein